MTTDGKPAPSIRAVHRASPYPLYWQVEHDLRQRIESGVWHPGDRLPSEQELSDLYGASRITIRQALGNIASDGLVSREPGRGTFVRNHKQTQGVRLTASFTEEMMQLGYDIGTRVLLQEIGPATAEIATHLAIEKGAPVHRVDRLRLTDGKPLAIQRACLPADRFPGLETADLTGSLYRYLRETYGVVPTQADEVIHACLVSADEQAPELFEVDVHHPCFLMERISSDDIGPVDFSRSLVRSDRYQIRLGLRSG
ncbi:MAG: UTRA domain-containing protein [Chloroflexi bacterium]|nr:UTRA domain-containing protein [Chloroflexota bacterium]